MAHRSHISPFYLRQIEDGLADITFHELIRLAHALDTDPGILAAGLEPADAPEPHAPLAPVLEITAAQRGLLATP